MKNCWILIFVLPFFGFSQVTLFSSDFNTGLPSNVINLDDDNLQVDSLIIYLQGAYHVVLHPDSTGGNDSCLAAASYFENGTQARNFLILPAYKLASFGNFLRFQAKSQDATYYDSFEVLYSRNGTNPMDFSDTIIFADSLVSPYWENYEINLDMLAGDSVHLAIHHNGNNGFIFYLDNVSLVREDPTSLEELSIDMTVYPNPTSDRVLIKVDADEIWLQDINGKFLTELKNGLNDVTVYPTGLYFIRARKNGISGVRKLLIQH
jgi:hypothetical protein